MISNPLLGSPKATSSGNGGITFLQKAIPTAIEILLVVGAVVFFFMLIIGAIQWIASGGDKQAIEGAKGKIMNAIIGLVVLFAVFAVVELIGNFFSVNLLNLTLPTLTGT